MRSVIMIRSVMPVRNGTRSIVSLSYDGDKGNDILSYDIYSNDSSNSSSSSSSSSSNNKDTAVFLHGILGSKRNWRTPAQTWLQLNPSYSTCITIDHRGHGKSNGYNNTINTIKICANDTYKTLTAIENKHQTSIVPSMLFAHSFGGKVALRYLEYRWRNGLQCPKHIWILDSMPGLYKEGPDDKQSVIHVMSLLSSLPKQYETREMMINQLLQKGLDKGVALWLATNLIPIKQDNGTTTTTLFQWGFDLNVITDLFHNFCNEELWSFLDEYNNNNKTDCTIHFLRAGNNTAWTNDIIDKLNSYSKKNIKFHTMPGVGHWLHSEDLRGMFNIIRKESGLL